MTSTSSPAPRRTNETTRSGAEDATQRVSPRRSAGWLAPERDHRTAELRELGAPRGDRPEHRKPLEQRRRPRLRRVAHLHAVVEQRDAVEGEHQHRGGEGGFLAEACDRPALVVVVGETQMQCAPRVTAALLLPGGRLSKGGGRPRALHHLGERAMERPGIIGVEGLHQQIGLVPLGEQEHVGLDPRAARPGPLPRSPSARDPPRRTGIRRGRSLASSA